MGLFKGIRDRAKKEKDKQPEKDQSLSQQKNIPPTNTDSQSHNKSKDSFSPEQLEELNEILIKIQSSRIDLERALKQMGNEISQAKNKAAAAQSSSPPAQGRDQSILQDIDTINNKAHNIFELLQDIRETLDNSSEKLQGSQK